MSPDFLCDIFDYENFYNFEVYFFLGIFNALIFMLIPLAISFESWFLY